MRDLITRPAAQMIDAPGARSSREAEVSDAPEATAESAVDLRCEQITAGGLYARRGKRVVDLALGVALAIVLSPLAACVAVLALATGGPPVFYGSERVGQGGRRFVMWKFRTMVADADDVSAAWEATHPQLASELRATWGLRHDPRVTWTGRFLRRSSLDELPQLWNVIRGDMSLVGPRPYLPRELDSVAAAHAIHAVKPGLTGPFQVGGRKDIPPADRMAIEATYGSRISLVRDIAYLVSTVKPLVKMDGR